MEFTRAAKPPLSLPVVFNAAPPVTVRNAAGRQAPRRDAGSALDAALAAAPLSRSRPRPASPSWACPRALVTALAAPRHRPRRSPSRPATLPDALAGPDVLGRAQTGSGKTLGFGLPMLARLAGGARAAAAGAARPRPRADPRARPAGRRRRSRRSARPSACSIDAVYGGAPIGRQIDALRRGVDLVVATPGRLHRPDRARRRATSTQSRSPCSTRPTTWPTSASCPPSRRSSTQTPAGGQRLLFSATLDRGVGQLVTALPHRPGRCTRSRRRARRRRRDDAPRPSSSRARTRSTVAAEIAARPARTLFFVRTKHGADRLAEQLARPASSAAGDPRQPHQGQRQRALDAFAAGQAAGAGGHRRRRPRHPRRRRRPGRALRPAERPQGLPAPLRPHGPRRRRRHGRGARADPSQVRDLQRMRDAPASTPTRPRSSPGTPPSAQLAASGTPVPPAHAAASTPRTSTPRTAHRGPAREETTARQRHGSTRAGVPCRGQDIPAPAGSATGRSGDGRPNNGTPAASAPPSSKLAHPAADADGRRIPALPQVRRSPGHRPVGRSPPPSPQQRHHQQEPPRLDDRADTNIQKLGTQDL